MARDYDAVRWDVGESESNLSNAAIDDLYDRAEAKYGVDTAATEAWTRVLVVRNLRAQAAKRVDYRQNQSSENLSDLYKNLKDMEATFLDDLQTALDSATGKVRFGGLKRYIPRLQEYPQDHEIVPADDTDVSRLDT